MTHRPRTIPAFFCIVCLVFAGCSGDPESAGPDTGFDTDLGADTQDDADSTPGATFCDACTSDDDCTDLDARCVSLLNGERACAPTCSPEGNDCPEDAFCASINDPSSDTASTHCVPNDLTCIARCDDVQCPAGQFCDPHLGDCRHQARICDQGCSFDTQCGSRDQFRCINTGAPDGESICTTLCDPSPADPNDIQCPADFFCIPLDEAAEEGVCFPMDRTCTNRCLDADCPAGHNCDPLTGDCIQAQAGACQTGCQLDAHCGGQNDRCLNVGIGEGPHCWRDCTDTQLCPDGYQCQSFLELTTSLCLPITRHCDLCYEADCFPGGICDPTTGECTPHPEDCTAEGCEAGQLCEPLSKRCVDIDRTCRGESWAADCDNVITRCSTRRAGTDGVCATLCIDDSDCHDGTTCTATNNGSLCLGPDLGGPTHCGILHDPAQATGRPCGDSAGSCFSPSTCIESGNVPGFCSAPCTTDADCPVSASCQLGPDATPGCIPNHCACTASPGLPQPLNDGWIAALQQADLNACQLLIPTSLLDAYGHWDDLLLRRHNLVEAITRPTATMGALQAQINAIDASNSLADLLFASAQTLDLDVTAPTTSTPTTQDLSQALQNFAQAAGTSLDTTEIDALLEDIPDNVQELASALVEALTDAYLARKNALQTAGISDDTLQSLFDSTHRLLLPRGDDQPLPDLSDPDLLQALQNLPLDEFTQIAIDLTARIDAAINAAELTEDDLNAQFQAIFHTPAGLIIFGDGAHSTYDPTLDDSLDGPIALLLDIGGDDTYRLPVAGNQSVDNGISLLIDLDGHDTYTYDKTGDPLDGANLLISDNSGRRTPAGPINTHNGPVSLSETPRQGGARFGIAMLFDRGQGDDIYETLRLGQGAAVFGVGALFDDGGTDHFEAEAFAQGASLAGIGLLHNSSGNDTYRLWHAGQGFASAGGLGLLHDTAGDDHFIAVSGLDSDDDLLYHSPTDSGNSNRNLAQGATSRSDAAANFQLAAGLAILHAPSGSNSFSAGSYAQGFAEDLGIALLVGGPGPDSYLARGHAQGVGQYAGAGILIDPGGNNQFNVDVSTRQLGQGTGQIFGWGAFLLFGGENDIHYMTPGGALAFDGGLGFALFHGGPNHHQAIDASMGRAFFDAAPNSPLAESFTAAFFIQTGSEDDSFQHPVGDQLGIENNTTWRQDDDDHPRAIGIGLDQ